MKEKLDALLGKIVGLTDGNRVVFGPLQTNGTLFGVGIEGFGPDNVKEIIPIEVEETKNAARAIIKL